MSIIHDLFTAIPVHTLPRAELLRILLKQFENTLPSSVVLQMMQTYFALAEISSDTYAFGQDAKEAGDNVSEEVLPTGTSSAAMKQEQLRPILPAAAAEMLKAVREEYGAQVRTYFFGSGVATERDLFRWCCRVARFVRFVHRPPHTSSSSTYLSTAEKEAIVTEAFDIFCCRLPWPSMRAALAQTIGLFWQVPKDRASDLMKNRNPDVQWTGANGKGTISAIGRVEVSFEVDPKLRLAPNYSSMTMTPYSRRLMETIAVCVDRREPVLLVGETGAGKTSTVQYLANCFGRKLVVQNLNLQTESADLVGGYRPVDMLQVAAPLFCDFVEIFTEMLVSDKHPNNAKFVVVMQKAFDQRKWSKLDRGFKTAIKQVNLHFSKTKGSTSIGVDEGQFVGRNQRPADDDAGAQVKRRALHKQTLVKRWEEFTRKAKRFSVQRKMVEKSFAFSFVEGELISAIRQGHWILLDEINLAPANVLQRLTGLLDSSDGSVLVSERGDIAPIARHPSFRLFAAMNPPTDVGKKALPLALRNRFSEIYVPEMTDFDDLLLIVREFLSEIPKTTSPERRVVDFYLEARKLAKGTLVDGNEQAPCYSLRSLCRALSFARLCRGRGFNLPRSLFEGFSLTFMTLLSDRSKKVMHDLMINTLLNLGHLSEGKISHELQLHKKFQAPVLHKGSGHVPAHILCAGFELEVGPLPPIDLSASTHGPDSSRKHPTFVITPSVRGRLHDLARAAVATRYPILLQGPTSSGKTSLVSYLASLTGHHCVRINNHEHTDLQEYIGSYVTDARGKLAFQEGALVQAVRNGHWIILDELNLAPSDVLEALNRLLDDNRELYVPETMETIRPHPHFMLFATQNPPGIYGGRKVMSRAFRNRFIEFHIGDIPPNEMVEILSKRTQIAPAFCPKVVEVQKELQRRRSRSGVFQGKHGFITPRDLLRWARRNPRDYAELAETGFMLLAERLRAENQKDEVKAVLERWCKSQMPVALNMPNLYAQVTSTDLDGAGSASLALTNASVRVAYLVGQCLQHQEPVLLVGATGSGKTTICQLMANKRKTVLRIVNCHQHTDASDIIGGLRPVRNKTALIDNLKAELAIYFERFIAPSGTVETESNTGQGPQSQILASLNALLGEGTQTRDSLSQWLDVHRQESAVGASLSAGLALFKTIDGAVTAKLDAATTTKSRISKSDRRKSKSSTKRKASKKNTTKRGVNALSGAVPNLPNKRSRLDRAQRGENDLKIAPTINADSVAKQISGEDLAVLRKIKLHATKINELAKRQQSLFEWCDGPLVQVIRPHAWHTFAA